MDHRTKCKIKIYKPSRREYLCDPNNFGFIKV